ncbi:MAG TPA: orotate phosphoribosyltransferase [Elusimicrobia bacterium]|nr:orotate phosphoribosyltransferase [Elusimicrobiota bacterium]HBT61458.1 orotate phosphoribosyltransferase [Elusimicrobiota bacterium]
MTAMNKMDLLGLLQEHGAVVSGHFQLASGLHSPVYLQTALVLQYPYVAQRIAKALAAKFMQSIDVVIAPNVASVVLAQEVARAKKCRAIFTERMSGMMALRRDFRIERGERALIVEDVITTGRLTAEIVFLAQAYGAKVVGVGAVVDRSVSRLSLSIPVRTLISYPLQVFSPDSCPQCKDGVALTDASRNPAMGAAEGE